MSLLKHDLDTLRDMNRIHLRHAVAEGVYYTERDSLFYSKCDSLTLRPPYLMLPQYTKCKPVRVAGDSVLMRYDGIDGDKWFAWIHA